MDSLKQAELARALEAIALASEQLTAAVRQAQQVIGTDVPAAEAPARVQVAPAAPAKRRSPALSAEPTVVRGEDDLQAALERIDPQLIHMGQEGGFSGTQMTNEERIERLACTLPGDVALEAAHGKLTGDSEKIDEMLSRVASLLMKEAAVLGVDVPKAAFQTTIRSFAELENRGSKWR